MKFKFQDNFLAEAKYYLEETNFDHDEAMRLFEEDVEFEKQFD